MYSEAATVTEYLASLPTDRRMMVEPLVSVIRQSLPSGYEEAMGYGMIVWQVPLATYPATYNKKPLIYAALASQKGYVSLYLMALYLQPETAHAFESAWRAHGGRWDAGKSCVRFRKLQDVPLELVATSVSSMSPHGYIDAVTKARNS